MKRKYPPALSEKCWDKSAGNSNPVLGWRIFRGRDIRTNKWNSEREECSRVAFISSFIARFPPFFLFFFPFPSPSPFCSHFFLSFFRVHRCERRNPRPLDTEHVNCLVVGHEISGGGASLLRQFFSPPFHVRFIQFAFVTSFSFRCSV